MRSSLFAFVGVIALALWSCGQKSGQNDTVARHKVEQEEDGTLSLNLDKATCYSDDVNPSSNTAEWNVVVSKPGRFKVWLSSATTDTTHLQYLNSVKISLQDNLLEVDPVCDKIVHNSKDVSFPYFRADSYMGSFYISEPGEYNIQVISEKIAPRNEAGRIASLPEGTRLMSVILTPMTR